MSARIIMKLVVEHTRDIAPHIKTITLRHGHKPTLPAWAPGAHVDVHLPEGRCRQYSLISDPQEPATWTIAVQREADGRGGSQWLHDHVQPGSILNVSAPRNNFPLSDAPAVFVAGGIGITPMLAMAQEQQRRQRRFDFHFCSRHRDTPFPEMLDTLLGEDRARHHVSSEGASARLDLPTLIRELPDDTHLYVCGPERLVDAAESATSHWTDERLHVEIFSATIDENYKPEPFDITVAATGKTYRVPADQSALEVLRDNGYVLPSSCELGVCGSCECEYRNGTVIHRDKVLRTAARQHRMMLCVSRARVNVTVDVTE